MDSYKNIKAFRAAEITLKGYSESENKRGLAWSCKVYSDNKRLGRLAIPGLVVPHSVTCLSKSKSLS